MKIYIFLLEPDFNTVTPFMTLISGVSLHEFVNLSFMFCQAFLELRKFCQLYDNFDEKTLILFGRCTNFLMRG